MSQAKVEKHKQEKYNRKNAPKKPKYKKILAYAGATLVAAFIIIYVGYSIAVETGLYKPEEATTAFVSTVSPAELESVLQSNGDVLGFYNKAMSQASENSSDETSTDAEETSAAESSAEETTAAKEAASAEETE